MFGKKKTEAGSSIDFRKAALSYIQEEMFECEGSCDLGVVLGAAGLAEKLNLITHDEYLEYHSEAYRRHEAYTKAKEEERKRKAAEYKAAVAAAKAAKQK